MSDDRRAKNMTGIGWICLSVIGASAMSVAVKALGTSLDSRMIVALRAAMTLLLLLPLAFVPRLTRQLRFSRPGLHFWRGLMIALATHLGFYTLTQIPLATAAVLFFTAPIFATALHVLVHGESVGPRRWSAVAAGFIGALIILRPEAGLHPAMLAALVSSAFFSIALTLSRAVAEVDGAASTYLSSVVITFVVSIPLAAPVYALPTGGGAWALLAVCLAGAMLRGFSDIEAYRLADAAVLAPVTYLRLVLIGVAGYLFFDEVPDTPTYVGASIIIVATFYIARREAQVAKHNRADPQA